MDKVTVADVVESLGEMTPEQLSRVQAKLRELLGLPPEDQDAYGVRQPVLPVVPSVDGQKAHDK